MTASPPFLQRVRIQNYKSIAECDVELGAFTVIVGRNGSGKSNFHDALRFVTEAFESSLDFAFKSRGGVDDVFRRTFNAPPTIAIDLKLSLPSASCVEYGFEIALTRGGFQVQREMLRIQSDSSREFGFETKDGILIRAKLATHTPGKGDASFEHLPKPALDRLYLATIAGLEEFRFVYDALGKMCYYNLNIEQMRTLHKSDSSRVLRRDGSNLSDMAMRLFDESPRLKQRLLEYLAVIVPEVVDICPIFMDGFGYLRLLMRGEEGHSPLLHATSISDGTLRVIGHLIASMQFISLGNALTLVAIEEPETALHPAAAALIDALREAATQTQIIITSHSPDLVDGIDPDSDVLLVAQMQDGRTEIDAVDSVGELAIRDHLFSAGELLRLDQLQPKSPIRGDSAMVHPAETMP